MGCCCCDTERWKPQDTEHVWNHIAHNPLSFSDSGRQSINLHAAPSCPLPDPLTVPDSLIESLQRVVQAASGLRVLPMLADCISQLCNPANSMRVQTPLVGVERLLWGLEDLIDALSSRGWLLRLQHAHQLERLIVTRLLDIEPLLSALGVAVSSDKQQALSVAATRLHQAANQAGITGPAGWLPLLEGPPEALRACMVVLAPHFLRWPGEAHSSLKQEVVHELAWLRACLSPGAHLAIRHDDCRLFWSMRLKQEKVSWDVFWQGLQAFVSHAQLHNQWGCEGMGHLTELHQLIQEPGLRSVLQHQLVGKKQSEGISACQLDLAMEPGATVLSTLQWLLSLHQQALDVAQHGQQLPHMPTPREQQTSQLVTEVQNSPLLGRDALVGALLEQLVESEASAVILHGQQGAGKSALATSLGHMLVACQHWRTVRCVDLRHCTTMEEAAEGVCAVMGVPLPPTDVPGGRPPALLRLTNHLQAQTHTQQTVTESNTLFHTSGAPGGSAMPSVIGSSPMRPRSQQQEGNKAVIARSSMQGLILENVDGLAYIPPTEMTPHTDTAAGHADSAVPQADSATPLALVQLLHVLALYAPSMQLICTTAQPSTDHFESQLDPDWDPHAVGASPPTKRLGSPISPPRPGPLSNQGGRSPRTPTRPTPAESQFVTAGNWSPTSSPNSPTAASTHHIRIQMQSTGGEAQPSSFNAPFPGAGPGLLSAPTQELADHAGQLAGAEEPCRGRKPDPSKMHVALVQVPSLASASAVSLLIRQAGANRLGGRGIMLASAMKSVPGMLSVLGCALREGVYEPGELLQVLQRSSNTPASHRAALEGAVHRLLQGLSEDKLLALQMLSHVGVPVSRSDAHLLLSFLGHPCRTDALLCDLYDLGLLTHHPLIQQHEVVHWVANILVEQGSSSGASVAEALLGAAHALLAPCEATWAVRAHTSALHTYQRRAQLIVRSLQVAAQLHQQLDTPTPPANLDLLSSVLSRPFGRAAMSPAQRTALLRGLGSS